MSRGALGGFDVLCREAPFALSRCLGGFVLSPMQELLMQTPCKKLAKLAIVIIIITTIGTTNQLY